MSAPFTTTIHHFTRDVKNVAAKRAAGKRAVVNATGTGSAIGAFV